MKATDNRVPLLDLKEQYLNIKEEIFAAITPVIEEQSFILGPEVEAFEKEVSSYCGAKYAIGVSSGTDALLLSMMALKISPKDEVITTPYTFFATAGSIVRLGARPVFVDIDPVTFNIDPKKINSKLTAHTKAVMPVHLFGQIAEMTSIRQIAEDHQLFIIEDAAQAIGAKYLDKMAGNLGDFGCFSFFPSKNLGGFGDSGMITTNDEELAKRVFKLRVHGGERRYYHEEVGGNFRIDALQATVLRVKLKYLDSWSKKRRDNANLYQKLFLEFGLSSKSNLAVSADNPLVIPAEMPHNFHVYNQYVIRARKRDQLIEFLDKNLIGSAIYYPLPLHLQKCFSHLGYKEGDFPESEKLAKESLALPIYPELKEAQIYRVAETIRRFYETS